MTTPNEPMKHYKRLLDKARQANWRVSAELAEELSFVAVAVNHIPADKRLRLAYGLTHGEYYVRPDGNWACTTCAGNCGQCGKTDMLGNIGFSFDQVVNSHQVVNPHQGVKVTDKPEKEVSLASLFWLSVLVWVVLSFGYYLVR